MAKHGKHYGGSSGVQRETPHDGGSRPVVGQSGRAYVSGGQAHGVHQRRTATPESNDGGHYATSNTTWATKGGGRGR
jgi:hypothetical protein